MRRPKFKDASEIRYQINDSKDTDIFFIPQYRIFTKGQEKSSTRDDIALQNLVL